MTETSMRTPNAVQAYYDEPNDVWMVAAGRRSTPADARSGDQPAFEVIEHLHDGHDGYTAGRDAAEQDAERWGAERDLPVLPPYDTVGQV